MSRDFLPRQDVAFSDASGRATNPFYVWLQGMDRALKGGATVEEIEAQIAELRQMIESLPTEGFLPNTTNVFGTDSILTVGTLADGIVWVRLQNDVPIPYPFQYYGVDANGARSWRWLYDALSAGIGLVQTMDGFTVLGVLESTGDLPVSSDVGDAYLIEGHLWAWDGADWIDEGAASGVTMFSLAELPNSGAGQSPIKIYTRDAYGRIEGDEDADTDNLPEGATNLYFTDERAQDAVGAIVGDTTDIDLTYNDAAPSITGVLTPAIHASLDLADSALQSGDNVSELVNDAGYVTKDAFSGALVVKTATQAIANATDTTVIFGAASYDTDGYFSAGSPTRLTVTTPGIYIVAGSARYQPNNVGYRRAQFFLNSGSYVGRTIDVQVPATGQNTVLNLLSPPVFCSAGDFFEMETIQDSGGSLNLPANDAMWFAIRRIADLS